ncbi:efflux RND transporter periplasmic adaptor subunit [Stakelama saccharophila]|uniref:Efflux RND transporter periplasmic adaptor subunit n=1 Tax=Stakelama saccharophila TaxID=3075605 RepID=A0ABZ0BAP1_9SPHN|nr:efflux RND transporter periplasmic adaptor subunit [Stakelama sp. W311]WNO54449.1 efflux RND transporter periplasmic adaptor subunit [Stakelama sp. W311]
MPDQETEQLDEFLGAKPRPRWRLWLKWGAIVVGVLLLGLLVSHCVNSGGATGYITQPVKKGSLDISVTATGNLKPTNQVQVGSEVSGRIDQVLVDVNDHVTRGQRLAVINTDVINDQITQSRANLNAAQARVEQAQATLQQDQASLERLREVQKLSGGRVPAKTEMETAVANVARDKAQVRSAQADVAAAEAQLSSNLTNRSRAVIVSPITGVVLAREVEPGQTVAASFNTPTLFVLAQDLSQMQLEVSIDEADVGQVEAGQKATFTVDAYPGRQFPATISRVDLASNTTADTSSSTTTTTATNSVVSYKAVLDVQNPDGLLRPGMTATATIRTEQTGQHLLVPNGALRFEPSAGGAGGGGAFGPQRFGLDQNQQATIGVGSKQTVYRVGPEGKPQAISVVTGASDGQQTIVESDDLRAGMKVITGKKAAGS